MHVEVVYANPTNQLLIALEIFQGASVRDAILQSGILEQFPEIDLTSVKVGIFSKQTSLDTILHEGERVEIYRKLLVDPKQARRVRAKG